MVMLEAGITDAQKLKRQFRYFIAVCCIIALQVVNLFATEIWTLTTAPYNGWVAVASSADGNTLVAVSGLIYVSTNSGACWTAATNAPGGFWTCVTISADGSKMAAGIDGGGIYTSRDYGVTWNLTTAPVNYWESITCSTDGSKLAAAAFSDGLDNTTPGEIHLSQNSGVSWVTPRGRNRKLNNVRQFWLSIASSSDGSKLVAVDSGGSIFTSKDSGITWSLTSAPEEPWFSVASSTNGNKLVAVANAGPIYTSANGGLNWKAATNAPNAGWASVTSSSDGNKLAAVQWGGQIYTSSDAGATWLQNNVPDIFVAVGIWGIASSRDGCKILAAGDGPYGGPVYLFQSMPILNIEHNNTNVSVSWPSSATGFVLQRNSDFNASNWMDVSITQKVLNEQNRVSFSPENAIQLFRLEFPTGSPPPWWRGPVPVENLQRNLQRFLQ
jgi:photosystem II stability/assembly factor-like uncharacterized protein